MCNNYMVTRVIVLLSLVKNKTRISEHCSLSDRKRVNVCFLLNT